MREITMPEYTSEKIAFFHKYSDKEGCKEHSTLEDNIIHKEYCFEDGAVWYEVSKKVCEKAMVEKHRCRQLVDVWFYQTEIWTTDDSTSRYLYEVA